MPRSFTRMRTSSFSAQMLTVILLFASEYLAALVIRFEITCDRRTWSAKITTGSSGCSSTSFWLFSDKIGVKGSVSSATSSPTSNLVGSSSNLLCSMWVAFSRSSIRTASRRPLRWMIPSCRSC
jgi:hypothetical protein